MLGSPYISQNSLQSSLAEMENENQLVEELEKRQNVEDSSLEEKVLKYKNIST